MIYNIILYKSIINLKQKTVFAYFFTNLNLSITNKCAQWSHDWLQNGSSDSHHQNLQNLHTTDRTASRCSCLFFPTVKSLHNHFSPSFFIQISSVWPLAHFNFPVVNILGKSLIVVFQPALK